VQKKLKKKKSIKQLFTKEVQEPLPEENSQTMDQEKNSFANQNAFDPQSTPEMEHESQRKQKRRQKRRPVQKIIGIYWTRGLTFRTCVFIDRYKAAAEKASKQLTTIWKMSPAEVICNIFWLYF